MRSLLAAALALLALALSASGCESTQEKSAKLEKAAKHERLALQGVSVSKQNPDVRVLASEVVRGMQTSAVVVHLRDTSSKPIVAAPIAIAVRDGAGKTVYQNNAPGEDSSLTTVSLQPSQDTVWIDDQVHSEAAPASASAKVGEGTHPSGATPKLSVEGLHSSGEGGESGAEGSVKNQSGKTQLNLVVFVLASRGGKTVAAGRAVLPEVLPGASDSFQVFFVGDASGATLRASVPVTSF
ncbi:MAG TPA: hypothetical protein VFR48_09775 [Solirubrobacteraceae bacterium]|nr:hypothetical protein [Solirubrobacteraceae bacterium]